MGAVDMQCEYILFLRLQAEPRMSEPEKSAEQNVGRVSASVTRRTTGGTNQDVGLRDKAANPTYGTLAAMRDTLLPKLISGELRVPLAGAV